ncbi:MAG: CRISPR system precrRNA processing endoribonuclease RAMP protein Cas6 [Candidatus Competibacteraceae bacterium]
MAALFQPSTADDCDGGIIGELTLTGDKLAPFWPYLWLGQWTHVGKGAVMGLGQYRLLTDPPLSGAPLPWVAEVA